MKDIYYKIMVVLLCFVFVCNGIYAFEFDNWGTYDDVNKKMVIDNAFTLGDNIANVTLKSPEVKEVMPGRDRLVAEFEVDSTQNYVNVFNDMEFYDMNDGMKKINRDVRYKKKIITGEHIWYTYSDTECENEKDRGKEGFVCDSKVIGQNVNPTYEWVEINPEEGLLKGDITIGLFVEVIPGDTIEWIPTIYGIRIDEWAVWNATFEEDLSLYYDCSNAGDNAQGVHNLSSFAGSLTFDTTNSLIGEACQIRDNKQPQISGVASEDVFDINEAGKTWNIWMAANNSVCPGGESYGINTDDAGADFRYEFVSSCTSKRMNINGIVGDARPLVNNAWFMVTILTNSSGIFWYENGTVQGTKANPFSAGAAELIFFNRDADGTDGVGQIDEMGFWNKTLSWSQINDLYNSGSGLGIVYPPVVTLSEPINNTKGNGIPVNFVCNATDETAVTQLNLTINGVVNESVTGASATLGLRKDFAAMPEGNYNWSCTATDGTASTTNGTFLLVVDRTDPTVTIDYPTTNITDFSFATGGNRTSYLNITVSDATLDTCWFYNVTSSENDTITCGSNVSMITSYGTHTLFAYANDSVNNIGSDSQSVTYSFLLLENSQSYNTSTTEFSTESFAIDLNYTSSDWSLITGRLWYNGTFYAGTQIGTGNRVTFSRTLTVPNVVGTQNLSLHWEIGLTNSTSTYYYNASTRGQYIDIINMSYCGNPYKLPFLNFTAIDELTGLSINMSFEATFDFGTSATAQYENLSYSDITQTDDSKSFCFVPNGTQFVVDANIEYGATNYITRNYNFQDLVVNNQTQNFTLYLLTSGNSTSFVIKVRDSDYTDVPNAEVYIQKYDTGIGDWVTTEIVVTNFDGETIGHFITEDATYRFLVYVNGVLELQTSGTKVFVKSTPATITLTLPQSLGELNPFGTLSDFSGGLSYDTTNYIFTYSYSDTSGSFVQSRLYVTKIDYGNGTQGSAACNVTSSSATGVLTCDISSITFSNGTYVASAYNSRSGDNNRFVGRIVGVKEILARNLIGLDGVLWSLFLFMTIVMVGIYRPSISIIFSIIGIIMLKLLGLMDIGISFVISAVAIGAVLLLEAKRQ